MNYYIYEFCVYELLWLWIVVSIKYRYIVKHSNCRIHFLNNLWIFVFMIFWVFEFLCLWFFVFMIFVFMYFCVYKFLCLWIFVSMNFCVNEFLCQWIFVSVNCYVYELFCLWIMRLWIFVSMVLIFCFGCLCFYLYLNCCMYYKLCSYGLEFSKIFCKIYQCFT